MNRDPVDNALLLQFSEKIDEGHKTTRNGCCPRSSICLNDITIDVNGSLTQGIQIRHRPQGPADQALNLMGPAPHSAP